MCASVKRATSSACRQVLAHAHCAWQCTQLLLLPPPLLLLSPRLLLLLQLQQQRVCGCGCSGGGSSSSDSRSCSSGCCRVFGTRLRSSPLAPLPLLLRLLPSLCPTHDLHDWTSAADDPCASTLANGATLAIVSVPLSPSLGAAVTVAAECREIGRDCPSRRLAVAVASPSPTRAPRLRCHSVRVLPQLPLTSGSMTAAEVTGTLRGEA